MLKTIKSSIAFGVLASAIFMANPSFAGTGGSGVGVGGVVPEVCSFNEFHQASAVNANVNVSSVSNIGVTLNNVIDATTGKYAADASIILEGYFVCNTLVSLGMNSLGGGLKLQPNGSTSLSENSFNNRIDYQVGFPFSVGVFVPVFTTSGMPIGTPYNLVYIPQSGQRQIQIKTKAPTDNTKPYLAGEYIDTLVISVTAF